MRRINFLLVGINAKYIHLNPALYSLKYSVSEEERSCVSVAEYTINHVYEHVLMDIFRRKPDVIGFSCYIWNMDMVRKLCSDLARVLPDVPIWLGGPEAAFAGEELFCEMPSVSGVMYGEGEAVFPRLLHAYLTDTAITGKGLRIRERDGGITDTGMPENVDMDSLPFFYDREDFNHRIIYYESSRGCPFRCGYCLSASEKPVRFRSLSLVLPELLWFLDRRVSQVKFLDRTFNVSPERTLAVWRFLAEHDNGVTNFHFEITADLLNDEEVSFLNTLRPGLIQLEIGVQSTNPETLAAISRRPDTAAIFDAVKKIGSTENVHQHLDLIAGLPYEDMKSFERSFNEVYALRPSQLQLGFLKVLKGSPLAAETERFAMAYRDCPPYEILSTKWMSYGDIVCLKGVEEMVEVYFNSHQFDLTVRALEGEYSSAFGMFRALSEYCRTANPDGKSLSRAGIYEQLKGFIHENFLKHAEIFDTLLTLDYYLREHAGNRPSFAVGKELPCPGHSRDRHREEIGFDLELFFRTGEIRRGTEVWLIDYEHRSPITNNALLKKERC